MTSAVSSPEDEAMDKEATVRKGGKKKKVVFSLFWLLVLLTLSGAFLWWWLEKSSIETTDDAFIDGSLSKISTEISGRISRVYVKDNQFVRQGTLLAELDARDEQLALEQAQAILEVSRAQVHQNQASLQGVNAKADQARAQLVQLEAERVRVQNELSRYQSSSTGYSESVIESKETDLKKIQATVAAQRKHIKYIEAQKLVAGAALEEKLAQLANHKIAVKSAQLQLDYTRIIAARDGFISRKEVNPGDYVKPGQALMYLVGDKVWVTANFKEIQLQHMKPGQQVRIEVDAWPERYLTARVDSIQRATGSVFSVLPAENATGNFVKVVQRVPVKIVFDDPTLNTLLLIPGMSVIPHVDVRS